MLQVTSTRSMVTTDITDFIISTSLITTEQITNQVTSADFSIRKYGDRTFQSELNDEIQVYDEEEKVFRGRVVKINETVEAPGAILYQVQCAGSAFELESTIVVGAFEDMSVLQIIQELVSDFAPNFTTDNVMGDFVIERIVFNNIPFGDALRRLAKILNYQWYVDTDDDIHFIPKFNELAPFDLTDSSGNYVYKSLARNIDGTQIVNRVIVRGGEFNGALYSDIETVKGNDSKSFKLPYKFANLVIEVDSGSGFVNKTVGIDFINDFSNYDVLYNFQDRSYRFEFPLNDGDLIRFTGNPKIPVVGVSGSEASILKYGQRDKVIRDRSIEDQDTAKRRAVAELQVYANEIEDASFFTYTPGLRAGMLINLTSLERDCDTDFIIKKVSFQPIDPNTFGYKVDCVTTQKYELIDLLRYILEPETDQNTENEIAELIEFTSDEVTVAEVINRIDPEQDIFTVEISENIQENPLGTNTRPIWVWGYYFPSSINDPKRMGYWGQAVWEETPADLLLLEDGEQLLLEDGDKIIL